MLERREVAGLAGQDRLAGELAEDQTFEQRIAAEPVGSVQARRGHFAAGVEVLDVRAGQGVGLDAADHVVGARADRDQIVADVDVEALAQVADQREPLGEELLVHVPDVQVDMRGVGLSHLGEDGPAHDIAGGQFKGLVVVPHEPTAFRVEQVGAFAAESLGDQRAGRSGDVQRRRVELHELQVAQDRSGPVGHRQSVRRGDRGIGRFAIELAGAAGGQDRVGRPDDLEAVILVVPDDADAAVRPCR